MKEKCCNKIKKQNILWWWGTRVVVLNYVNTKHFP